MSEFPFGFDYETLTADEDRELRKLASAHYSDEAADYIMVKYMVADNWQEYDNKVRNLISRKLSEAEFVKAVQQLNFKFPCRLY